MITAKFGGTAITPRNLHFVKRCLTPSHNVVVVSAVGREHPQDVKATDLLRDYYITRDETLFDAFCAKYRRLVEVNGVPLDVDELLFDARSRATGFNLDYCMSLGEELSAKITAKYLSATYVEAEQNVKFCNGKLLFDDTVSNLANTFDGVKLAVTGGFYGGGKYSRAVFSRGGGDVTGALCAVAANASLYENWTDAYGVCVADPVKVSCVSTVNQLSYDEMFFLANAGAQVLHPDAISPCRRFGVPIRVGNFYNPNGASTLVSNCASRSKILSVAEKINADGRFVTTVLHSLSADIITRCFADFFRLDKDVVSFFCKPYALSRFGIVSLVIDERSAAVCSDKSVLSSLYNFFKSQGLIE